MTGQVIGRGSLPLPERRMLTAAQAADYLGVSIAVLKRDCPAAPLQIGRHVRWDRQALDAWVDSLPRAEPEMTGEDWLRKLG